MSDIAAALYLGRAEHVWGQAVADRQRRIRDHATAYRCRPGDEDSATVRRRCRPFLLARV